MPGLSVRRAIKHKFDGKAAIWNGKWLETIPITENRSGRVSAGGKHGCHGGDTEKERAICRFFIFIVTFYLGRRGKQPGKALFERNRHYA